MIINPNLSLEKAAQIRLQQMYEQSDYQAVWKRLSALDRLLLITILKGENGLYKTETRQQLAEKLGISEEVSTSALQTSLKKLERHELITKQSDNSLILNGSLFKNWLAELLLEN